MKLLRGALLLTLISLLGACERGPGDPISERAGDWLFINYWAEWCKPCIQEIPELNALDREPGYAVLGVNFDGATGEELSAQVEKLGVAFPTLAVDPGERFGVPTPQVLPTTLVISPTGELAGVLIGPQTSETLIEATAAHSEG